MNIWSRAARALKYYISNKNIIENQYTLGPGQPELQNNKLWKNKLIGNQ